MAKIVTLKDKDNNTVYPQTKIEAVYDEDGNTVMDIIGEYGDNTEFIQAVTDSNDKLLYGVKEDGDFYFGAGVPSQIEEKYHGIDSIFSVPNNPEWLDVKVDSEDTILEGIKADGTKVVNLPIETPSVSFTPLTNPEWIHATSDSEGKVLEGITTDGKKKVMIDTQVPSANINGNLIIPEQNPEWISADVDSDRRLIQGIKTNGVVYINNLDCPSVDEQVQDAIDEAKEYVDNKVAGARYMKITKSGTNLDIRSSFSSEKDIIITFRQDPDGYNMSPNRVYLGLKAQTNDEIKTSGYSCTAGDIVGAIGVVTFWYLYAQHGWSIVRIMNPSVALDSSDIGAIWKDQNNNEFLVADINSQYVDFMPKVTLDGNDIYRASWDPTIDPSVTQMTYVSGGTHTGTITGSSVTNPQKQIQTAVERSFIADGVDITTDGEYYCDVLVIKERLLGHNPAFVSYYPSFSYGESLIDWDRCFIVKGSSITCNTTFDVKHDFELKDWRGCVPMMPLQSGDYKSWSFIPKVKKVQNSHRLDMPFASNDGLASEGSVWAVRNSNDLYDKDDQPDRVITYLQKDGAADYLIGVSGGYSLTTGLSLPEYRNQYVPEGTETFSFGGASTPNKFYPKVLRSAGFSPDGVVSDSFVGNLSCYFCWFNPNDNKGQVYWYKESDGYVVYAHCQEEYAKVALNLPDFMEGMTVESVIEKTEGASLLTKQVVSGKIYVGYARYQTDNYANYIVFKVK